MEKTTIDLRRISIYLMRHIYLPILCCILCGAAAFGVTKYGMTPIYRATTRIYILYQASEESIAYADMQSSRQLATDCEVLITGKNVTREVISRLGLDCSDSELASALTVSRVEETRVLQIDVTDSDPTRAAEIANCVREVAAEQLVQIMGADAVNVVFPASVPTGAIGPSLQKNVLLAVLGGFLAVCALLVARFMLDETIRNEEDVMRYLGLNTIGLIPAVEQLSKKRRGGK